MASHGFNEENLNKEPQNGRDSTQRKLLQCVETEVEKRLQKTLRNGVYIVLDKENDSTQVQHPWKNDIKFGEQQIYQLPKNTSVEQVFDRSDIAGRLLILGGYASGKTTTLFKLAEQLVKRAKDNPQHPIPVLLNLYSWRQDEQTIEDWMSADIKAKYGVSQDITKKWVKEEKIIPLLDSLDELKVAKQEKIIEKLNDFLHPETWSREFVVCCRLEEYQNYSTNLRLNSSIILKPLTTEQIKDYILKTEGNIIWERIKAHSEVIEATKTPLSLFYLAINLGTIFP